MFEHLTEYKRILVCGPQRSGTRIAAHMIAHDTGHTYVDEMEFHVDSLHSLYWVLERENIVVQCPALTRYVHIIAKDFGAFIVMMHRDLEDIYTSQRRIGWDFDRVEMMHYPEYSRFPRSAYVKHIYWNGYQQERVKNFAVVDYDSLSEHLLWIPKERRANFGPYQWEEE